MWHCSLTYLVGEVDAELFERVLLEAIEAEDVQDADVADARHHWRLDQPIHLLHDPAEHSLWTERDSTINKVQSITLQNIFKRF